MITFIKENKFARFVIVGGINTVFGYSVFASLMYVGLHYSLAVLLGTVIGVLFNFKTTGRLVFKVNNNILLFRFVSVYVFMYVLNVAALELFDYFKANLYIAGLLLIVPLAIVSYVLQRKFVFKEPQTHAVD